MDQKATNSKVGDRQDSLNGDLNKQPVGAQPSKMSEDGNPQMNKGKQPGQGGNKPQQQKGMQKSHWFLILMVVSYVVLYLTSPAKTDSAIQYVLSIFKELIPILVLVYVFMFLFSLINEKKMRKYIENAPMALKYVLMSILGTLSHGPIYAWYPLLKDFNEKGLSLGPISTFLYSRGIKLTLIPMLISFFDLKYAIILTVTTLVFSIVEGIIIEASYRGSN